MRFWCSPYVLWCSSGCYQKLILKIHLEKNYQNAIVFSFALRVVRRDVHMFSLTHSEDFVIPSRLQTHIWRCNADVYYFVTHPKSLELLLVDFRIRLTCVIFTKIFKHTLRRVFNPINNTPLDERRVYTRKTLWCLDGISDIVAASRWLTQCSFTYLECFLFPSIEILKSIWRPENFLDVCS